MAAIAKAKGEGQMTSGRYLLLVLALVSAGLAVAAALYALWGPASPASPSRTAADEGAAREERVAFFEARAAADPLDFISLNVLAGEYLQRARETGDISDYRRAETAATKSLGLVPEGNYSGLVNLASVRLVQHRFDDVETLALEAKALKPSEPAPYGLLADAMVGFGQYDEASGLLETMLQLDAGLGTYSRLAHLAFLRGDEVNAIEFWKQAIAQGEDAPREHIAWAQVQLGATYFALGDLSDAASRHESALRLYPGYVHALAGLGQVRATQGRLIEAIELYERAVARLPQPQYVAALGDAHFVAGREGEAATQFALVEAIAALYEDSGIETDLQIASYYADHDLEPARALEMARAAYETAPGVYAADALAWSLYRNGRYEEASRFSRKATALGTAEPRFYYHAALIYQALHDGDATQRSLERLEDLNPLFSPLQRAEIKALLQEREAPR